jgi:hypothetical protein
MYLLVHGHASARQDHAADFTTRPPPLAHGKARAETLPMIKRLEPAGAGYAQRRDAAYR